MSIVVIKHSLDYHQNYLFCCRSLNRYASSEISFTKYLCAQTLPAKSLSDRVDTCMALKGTVHPIIFFKNVLQVICAFLFVVKYNVLRSFNAFVMLKLPGVSENRPSVLRGDYLLLTKSEEVQLSTVTKYKGYVHRVELDQVKLGFSGRYEVWGVYDRCHLNIRTLKEY